MREFHLTMKLRNNLLRKRREELGLSVPKLAEACGVSYPHVLDLEGLKASPMTKSGEWRKAALALAEFFGCSPDDLFPESVLKVVAPEVKAELDAQKVLALGGLALEAEPPTLPDAMLSEKQLSEAINDVLGDLTPREREVLLLMYEDGLTLTETARKTGRGVERVRQIQAKALRKLRHPFRAGRIKAAANGTDDRQRPKTMDGGRVSFGPPKVFTARELALAAEIAAMGRKT